MTQLRFTQLYDYVIGALYQLKLMNETGITVYIRMTAGGLFHRLAESKANRPLIAGLTDLKLMDFIMDTLSEREHFYMKAQHVLPYPL